MSKRRKGKRSVPAVKSEGEQLEEARRRDRSWRVENQERKRGRWKRLGLWFGLAKILCILGTAYAFNLKQLWGSVAGVAFIGVAGLLTWLEKVADARLAAAEAALRAER